MCAKYMIPNTQEIKEYEYHIIRYFPRRSTYEFINIGIVVFEQDHYEIRLLPEKNIKSLAKFQGLDKKVIGTVISNVQNLLYSRKWTIHELRNVLKSGYKNAIDTSFVLREVSQSSIIDLADFLYEEYIGYRFVSTKKKKDKLEETKEKTHELIQLDFKNQLYVLESENDFHLTIRNQHDLLFYIRYGSLIGKQDVEDMHYRCYDFKRKKKKNVELDFFYSNSNQELDNEQKKVEKHIHMLNDVNAIPLKYDTNEDKAITLEKLARKDIAA